MSSQDNDAPFFVLFDHLPEAPSRRRVHSRGWLVKHDHFSIADQSYRYRELSSLTTRQSLSKLVLVLNQLDLIQHLVYSLLYLNRVNAFKRCI